MKTQGQIPKEKPKDSGESLGGMEAGSTTKLLLLSALGIFGFYKANAWYDENNLKKENSKAAEDNSSNIASQIHAENRANYTEDSVQIGLFRQITDYKKTKDAYLNSSKGLDMLEDTRKHVSSGAYQQILNILGIKGGAIQAQSQTAKDVQQPSSKFNWVLAKVDTRIRKSPKAGSAVFTLRPNVIGTAKAGTIIGIIDKITLAKNKGKLFYDDENSVFYIPVLVFNNKDSRKYYTAYVSASSINVFEKRPENSPMYLISEFTYNQAFAVSGIEGQTNAPTTNPLL